MSCTVLFVIPHRSLPQFSSVEFVIVSLRLLIPAMHRIEITFRPSRPYASPFNSANAPSTIALARASPSTPPPAPRNLPIPLSNASACSAAGPINSLVNLSALKSLHSTVPRMCQHLTPPPLGPRLRRRAPGQTTYSSRWSILIPTSANLPPFRPSSTDRTANSTPSVPGNSAEKKPPKKLGLWK